MAITIKNLFSESREILKNLINSNVIDPDKGYTNSRRRWIYREFPDTTSNDFAGYPIIVIKSPDIGDDPITLNALFREDTIVFEIEIYAEFNDTKARVDSLSDSVIYAILRETGQDTLADGGLFTPNIATSPFIDVTEDGKKLSARLITLEFTSELCF